MKTSRWWIVLALMMGAAAPAAAQTSLNYPEARRSDHVDRYHGVEVADPYRWMEDVDAPETRAWIQAQEELLNRFLEAVPERDALADRIYALWNVDAFTPPTLAGGQYFFVRRDARVGPATLYVQEHPEATPHPLFEEATRLANEDLNFTGFAPSPDGRFVAYFVRKGQSRWRQLRLLDAQQGMELPDTLTGLHTLGGNVSWTADGAGFFYTRFDEPDEGDELQTRVEAPQVYYHRRGTPQSEDDLVFERPDQPKWLMSHTVTDDGRYFVLSVRDGDTADTYTFYKDLHQSEGNLIPLAEVAGTSFTFLGHDGPRFYFYTTLDAPRGRIVAVDITQPARDRWIEVVPEADEPIAGNSLVGGNAVSLSGDHFIVTYLKDARPLVRVFDQTGAFRYTVDLPDIGAIWGGFSGRQDAPEVFYSFLSLTEASTIYRLDLTTGESTVFKRPDLGFAPDAFETVQVFYESEDGARVPLFITHKKGYEPDGTAPAFMYGYGAFGWVAFPWYQPHIVAWLEMGGIYALPGLRGGGEYGEDWHQAGMRHNKPTTIADYVAAAEWLIEHGYTSADRLVANGGSASGIVAAAAVMKRPDLFVASVIDIPALDMLRYHRFTAAGNWVQEFGSSDNPDDFEVLRRYSAYHNVEPGACYPPILTMVGERDETAVPMHGYKFTAALQAAQDCANPALLKVIRGAGHSHGTTPEQQAETWGDALAFLVRVLDLQVPAW